MGVSEATRPLLNSHIEIRPAEQLVNLFCERKRTRGVRVGPTRLVPAFRPAVLTLLFSSWRGLNKPLESISPLARADTRPPSASPSNKVPTARSYSIVEVFGARPLPLDRLCIFVHHGSMEFTILHLYRLPHLNPLRVAYEQRVRPAARLIIGRRCTYLPAWTRVETVEFRGAIDYSLKGESRRVAGVPLALIHRPQYIRLHLFSLLFSLDLTPYLTPYATPRYLCP